jgi:chromosomal replication initiator protein
MTDLWQSALAGFRPRVDAQTFELWLRPIELIEAQGDLVRLRAPNRFLKEWFENHFLPSVLEEIRVQQGRPYRAEIEIAAESEADQKALAEQLARKGGRRKKGAVSEGTGADSPSLAGSSEPSAAPRPVTHAPAASAPRVNVRGPALPPEGLSPRYVFSTLIRGASNELAVSAALAAVEHPGKRYNPLFIYGGSGLGKTHLLHAIGHALHQRHAQMRIAYLSAERFMNEFIGAVRHHAFDAFRERYREGCDCLLIDDIQFIAGKDRTMDEFFHVFNALYENGKQIVVTADRCPKEMEGMESRLISRLKWGLVADIQAPDLEMRVAILDQLCERDRVVMSRQAKVTLAEIVRANVRELEGAVVRVSALADLRGCPISETLVREACGPRTVQDGGAVTVDAILKAVSSYYSVKVAEIKGQRRHRGIARPRMLAMYLSRELTGASFPEIGQRFGGKDHTTVMNACRRIQTLCGEDDNLRDAMLSLRAQLQSRVA